MAEYRRGLDYYRRLLGTAISFGFFGVGGVLIGLVVLPLLFLLFWDRRKRELAGRRVLRHTWRFFVWLMKAVTVLDYEVIHGERLKASDGMLVVANHPSLIDVIFIVSLMEETNCIVNSNLLKNPAMIGTIKAVGYIPNNSGDQLLADCVASLETGSPLLVFPEGTRTVPGEPYRFQRGAGNIAVRAKVPVRPITITVEPTTLTKAEKWYQIPPRRVQVTIKVGEELAIEPFLEAGGNPSRAARQLTRYLENYFTQELADHERSGTGAETADNRVA